MNTCCNPHKPPKGVELWQVNELLTVQRHKTAAEGATADASGKVDRTLDANWVTVGKRYFAIKPTRGWQREVMDHQEDVTTAMAWTPWDEVTGDITASYRLIQNDGASDEKTWQVVGLVDLWETNDWVQLALAEVVIE